MLKQALEYIVGLKGGHSIIEQKGRTFLVTNAGEIKKEFVGIYQSEIKTRTLSSIVDYFAGNPDNIFEKNKKFIIHVKNIDRVEVMSETSDETLRNDFLEVTADLPESFPYGKYIDLETFNIMLQSRFRENDDRAKLLALTANVVDEAVKTYGDNGISQSATVKTGVSGVADVVVPNPVTLKPFRTFAEAYQPESKFVFRMRKDEDGVFAALFEADGGAWKVQAIQNIADYLNDCLQNALAPEELERITILS